MLETLDTLIAFVTVILVLSLLVTGLVQFLQYFFRFRGRTLERGLAGLLEGRMPEEAVQGAEDATAAARRVAGRVVRDPLLVHTPPSIIRNGLCSGLGWLAKAPWVGGLFRRLRSLLEDRTTWIEKTELEEALERVLQDSTEEPSKIGGEIQRMHEARARLLEEVGGAFDRWERQLTKRFEHRMRWISFVLSFLVVVTFQVDAFDLLTRLSADAELRNRIGAVTGEVLEEEAGVREMLDLRSAAEEALERLEIRHQDIQESLEQASGVGPDRASIVAELEAVLADRPEKERDAVLEEYRQLLDEVIAERRRRAEGLIDDALGYTARMGLELWGDDDFYHGAPWSRYLGVLAMVILVGFGAPFWFNQLRNLVALRDVLQRREDEARS